jgi:proline iminopeptidase
MFTQINGNTLYYEVLGEQNKQAILCFHGAPGMSSHREPKAAWGRLADRYKVVIQDQRGSGQSGLNPPFTHKQWVDDADVLRQYLNLGKVVAAGGSYGGYLAQEYALAYPQNTLAVMLRDTGPDHSHEKEAEASALSSPRTKDTLDYVKFRRIFDGKCLSDDDMRDCYLEIQPLYNVNWDPVKDAERIKNFEWHHKTHNFAFAHNLPDFDIKPRLHEVTAPVLITHGRHDWIIPVSAAEDMERLYPNAELVIFENSGHSPQIEEVDKWEATVRRFLADHNL